MGIFKLSGGEDRGYDFGLYGVGTAPIRIGVDLAAFEFQPLGFEATIGWLGEPSLPWKRSQG
jgi:hypothetical protein